MVDAQAVDRAIGVKPQYRGVNRVEDLVVLNAKRRELVDVKEATPVYLVIGHAPPRQTIVLLFEQFMQPRAPARRRRIEVGERRIGGKAARRDRKYVIEIANGESRRIVSGATERYFTGLQNLAVRPAEDGQQHLAAQIRVRRSPVDVEIFGVAAVAAARQDIHPPTIAAADGHVVGHDVDDQSKLMPAQLLDQPEQFLFAAELRIDPRRIDDVIAVLRSW